MSNSAIIILVFLILFLRLSNPWQNWLDNDQVCRIGYNIVRKKISGPCIRNGRRIQDLAPCLRSYAFCHFCPERCTPDNPQRIDNPGIRGDSKLAPSNRRETFLKMVSRSPPATAHSRICCWRMSESELGRLCCSSSRPGIHFALEDKSH